MVNYNCPYCEISPIPRFVPLGKDFDCWVCGRTYKTISAKEEVERIVTKDLNSLLKRNDLE